MTGQSRRPNSVSSSQGAVRIVCPAGAVWQTRTPAGRAARGAPLLVGLAQALVQQAQMAELAEVPRRDASHPFSPAGGQTPADRSPAVGLGGRLQEPPAAGPVH